MKFFQKIYANFFFFSSFLAMNYPNIKGVIIDASFDELLPLAVPRMPNFLAPLVSYSVKKFVTLNVAEQLKNYPGPVQLIRRTMDEMISTEMDSLISNRGNNLLVKLLEHRYPHLIGNEQLKQLWLFLSLEEPRQFDLIEKWKIDEDQMKQILSNDPPHFPSDLGKDDKIDTDTKTRLVLFLAKIYFINVDSTHCTPLPVDKFQIQWLNHFSPT